MSDGEALLAAILANPDEDTVRLEYADWLDERGEPGDAERAEFIRVQIELERLPPQHEQHYEPDELCTDAICPECGEDCGVYGCGKPECDTRSRRRVWLENREEELLLLCSAKPDYTNRCVWFEPFRRLCEPTADHEGWVFRRGFVESIRLPAADFLAYADGMRAQHPIRGVTLTTLPVYDEFGSRPREGLPNEYLYALGETAPDDEDPRTVWSERHASETVIVGLLLKESWPGITFTLPPEPV